MTKLCPSPAWPTVPVLGEAATYPVHRLFCVGRNYAAHAAEMGVEVDREAPFYVTKSALALQPAGGRLLIGAGGLWSNVRKRVAGDGAPRVLRVAGLWIIEEPQAVP